MAGHSKWAQIKRKKAVTDAAWAFTKGTAGYTPNSTVSVSDVDGERLQKLLETIEENDDVQGVFTNAE